MNTKYVIILVLLHSLSSECKFCKNEENFSSCEMMLVLALIFGLFHVCSTVYSAPAKVGDYAQVHNLVEKVFVDTSGAARKIWKGGVVVREDMGDGQCHITIKELRETHTEVVTYGVDCARLLPSDFQCPSAASVSYKCDPSDVACSSDSLFYNGFVVLTGPINHFPGSIIATTFAERKYSEMFSTAQRAGLDPHSLDFHFSDVSSRGPGRWEMQVTQEDLTENSMHWLPNMWNYAHENIVLPTLTGAVNRAHNAHTAAHPNQTTTEMTTPIFKAVFDGVLISTPGADTQHWHRDSGLHTKDISHYTVYIATAHVTPAMGPTEFLPGTNRDFSFKFDDWANYFNYCPTTERPLLNAGSILIWDYRTIHRGTRNIKYPSQSETIQQEITASGSALSDDIHSGADEKTNRNRPMLYRTYHLEGSWEDINMGDTSFYKLRDSL